VLSPGQQVGSWILEDVVALGIPRTFRARHDTVGTAAVLELVPLSKATMEGQKRKVDALQRLTHPSLPEVVDFGVDHEREFVWTAFKWFEGEHLHDRLVRGPLRWQRGCAVLRDLAHALVYVHGQGIVHRDLRPSNVVVGKVRTWLVGFDYALTQQQLEAMLQAPFGDLAYLAPEVLRDPTHHGARADVYAFGCVAYELLSGKSAFPAAAWGERADQATRMLEWKTRATSLDPGAPLPDWLRSLVQKCTEPSAERRLPDLDALVGWLDAARGSWDTGRGEISEDPGLSEDPEIEPVTAEVAIPIGVTRPMRPLIAAPTLVPVTPTLRAPPTPVTMPRSSQGAYAPLPPPPSTPPMLQYLVAAAFGGATALGLSAIVILFVELSNGTL
jgi:serine/threonine protein kinase